MGVFTCHGAVVLPDNYSAVVTDAPVQLRHSVPKCTQSIPAERYLEPLIEVVTALRELQIQHLPPALQPFFSSLKWQLPSRTGSALGADDAVEVDASPPEAAHLGLPSASQFQPFYIHSKDLLLPRTVWCKVAGPYSGRLPRLQQSAPLPPAPCKSLNCVKKCYFSLRVCLRLCSFARTCLRIHRQLYMCTH